MAHVEGNSPIRPTPGRCRTRTGMFACCMAIRTEKFFAFMARIHDSEIMLLLAQSAVKTIITSGAMVDYASTMADPNAAPDDRFHAVVRLEMMLWNNPSKRRVVAVLINLVKGKKPSVAELFRVEVLTTGERCLDW